MLELPGIRRLSATAPIIISEERVHLFIARTTKATTSLGSRSSRSKNVSTAEIPHLLAICGGGGTQYIMVFDTDNLFVFLTSGAG